MIDPLSYLDQLTDYQGELVRGLAEVEARLADARLARLAPVPVGDVGYRGLGPRPEVEPVPPVAVVFPSEPPADLEVGVMQAMRTGPKRAAFPARRTAPPMMDEAATEPEGTPGRRDSWETAELGSIVQVPVRIGSRWSLVPVAAARTRLPVTGPGGVLELFPSFDPRGAVSYEVESTLLSVERSGEGGADGLEVGPLVPSIVARDWVFRALPWTGDVKRSVERILRLPVGFRRAPVNDGGAGDGQMHPGEALLVMSVDPASARFTKEADSESAKAPMTPTSPGDHTPSHEDTQTSPDQPERDLAEVGAALRQAWDRFLAEGGEASFEEFVRAIAVFEQVTPQGVGPGVRQFLAEFPERAIAVFEHASPQSVGPTVRQLLTKLRERESRLPMAPGTDQQAERRSPDHTQPDPVELGQEPFSVRFDHTRLRRKYKHAPDFGVHDRYGGPGLDRYEAALSEHVAAVDDRYLVRDRGQTLVAHVGRGRIVWTTVEGAFVTAYRASPDQLRHVWAQPAWSLP